MTFASSCIIIQFKYINQPDATVSQVHYLTFMCGSTCFGRPHSHHQELNNCSSSLWFYRRSVVIAVLDAVNVQQQHVQQPSTYAKPESASAVLGSWWLGGVPPETRWASYKYEIKNFDTLLHHVGFSLWIILRCTDPRTSGTSQVLW